MWLLIKVALVTSVFTHAAPHGLKSSRDIRAKILEDKRNQLREKQLQKELLLKSEQEKTKKLEDDQPDKPEIIPVLQESKLLEPVVGTDFATAPKPPTEQSWTDSFKKDDSLENCDGGEHISDNIPIIDVIGEELEMVEVEIERKEEEEDEVEIDLIP